MKFNLNQIIWCCLVNLLHVFCWKHFMDICPNLLKRIVDESILPLPWDILDLSTEINRKEVTLNLKKSCNLFFKF